MKQLSARQEQIIKAAIELIAEKGIQQFTIKNLAAKINLAEGALYRHFKGKMDILLGILEQFRSNKTLALGHIQSSDQSQIEQLGMIFTERFKQFADNPALTAVIFSEEIFQNDKRLAAEVYSIMEASQATIQGIIGKGQENGLIRSDISAIAISTMLIGTLRFIVTRWHLSGFSFDLEEEGAILWSGIQKMIKK
jgi:TetR/AcrR family transcriptional regulator, fatty acid metabolism regulator protein